MKTLIRRLSTICISVASIMTYTFGSVASSLNASATVNNVNAGNYVLESALDSNKVADVAWGETTDESNLWLYERNYTDAQTFKITSAGNGYYTIQMAVTDNMVLDVCGSGYQGCNVQIYHYKCNSSNDDQLWSFEDAGDGYVYIKSKTGCYLDVSGGYSDDMTNIQVWPGNGTDSQRWKLVPCIEEYLNPSVVDIFKDINAEHWFVPDVQYVYERGIMVGKTNDIFDPFGLLLREEFVQALYNHIGKPCVSGTNPYPDVKEGAWYYNAVLWARQKDIANGYGNGNFGVGDPITREQFALMLYKYAKLRGYDLTAVSGKSSCYNDSSKISSWAKNAMDWAITQGLLTSCNNNINPQGNTTRAECAHSLKKLFERYE